MYRVYTYIYHKNQPNVGKYTNPMDPMGIGKNPPIFQEGKKVVVKMPGATWVEQPPPEVKSGGNETCHALTPDGKPMGFPTRWQF